MKKIIPLLLLIILLCGCEKKEKGVETIIEESSKYYISINYPTTNIQKIDQAIQKEVNQNLKKFKKEYAKHIFLTKKAELNIDYVVSTNHNQYISTALYTFINAPNLAHPIQSFYTITYDLKKKKIITLKDIAKKETWQTLLPSLKIQLLKEYTDCLFLNTLDQNFTIDSILKTNFIIMDENIILYFSPYTLAPYSCETIHLNIPIQKLNTTLLPETENKKEVISYQTHNKPLDFKKPTVALTFDDGPSKYTKEIINILKENNMNATFFILGNKVEIYQELLKESLQNGNELGNHSYNHKCLTKLKPEEQQEQLTKTTNIIKETLNYDITLFRPTYGSFNQQLKENTNLKMILWTVDTKDWKYKDSKTIATKALKDIKDGSIILMHDTHKQTINALKIILKELKNKGYQVVTISELQTIQKLRNETEIQ